MKTIQVLGTGCPKCTQLAVNAEAAAKELGIEYKVEKITDIDAITAAGVMMTPALRVDGMIKVSGRVPEPHEIESMLE